MLSQAHRIRKNAEIGFILKSGKVSSSGCARIAFIKNNLPEVRFAFIVGKKRFPKATARNTIKRRMREAARSILANIHPGHDIVFLFSGGAEQTDSVTIRESVTEALYKAHLLKNSR